ncbi:cupin domain-containing protein [Veillonella intestinalis]|uniref:cupin domain-containing protein n=1 Tax=Veillonella intestinalis TaxID=2941341 RepID=UPI002040D63E|nr:cupin domain-containing protein [Veillonella intestinalis]
MGNMTRDMIESLVRQIVTEKLMATKHISNSGVGVVKLPQIDVTEADRLDTGNPNDKVYTKDLFSLDESPRLGCGLMVMEDTTFDWTLNYDEIDYIISGELSIIINGETITAGPGEIVLIPKGSPIQFSVKGKARFVYVTYPADWQSQV